MGEGKKIVVFDKPESIDDYVNGEISFRMIKTEPKKNRYLYVPSFKKLKNMLDEYLQKNTSAILSDNILSSKQLKKNSALYQALGNLGYFITGEKSRSVKEGLKVFGKKTRTNNQNSDKELIAKLRSALTKDVLKKIADDKDRHVGVLSVLKKYGDSQAINAYNRIVSKRKLSLEDAVNKAAPYAKLEFGKNAYNIICDPFTDKEVSKILNDLLYSGKEITRGSISKLPRGNRLIQYIQNSDKFKDPQKIKNAQKFENERKKVEKELVTVTKSGNFTKRKRSYSESENGSADKTFLEKTSNFMNYPFCGRYDLAGDTYANRDIGVIFEKMFEFTLTILKKYDSDLSSVPDLRSTLGGSITDAFHSSDKKSKEILTRKGIQYADTVPVIDMDRVVVEIKKTTYKSNKQFYKNLEHYDSAIHTDGDPVKRKVLIIGKPNGTFEAMKRHLNSKEWVIASGDQMLKWYNASIDALFESQQEFSETSPMNSAASLKEIGKRTHEQAHILARRGHGFLRKAMSDLLTLDMSYMLGYENVFESGSQNMPWKISFKLSDYRHIYKKDPLALQDKVLLYDGEATGFRNFGSTLITHSLGYWDKDDLMVDVYFVRNPLEEKETLEAVKPYFENADYLVTFNGKTYDFPLLQERMFSNLIKFNPSFEHIDLLSDYWRPALKNHFHKSKGLEIFERLKLGFVRNVSTLGFKDIPGSEIPQEYLKYVLGQPHKSMDRIIQHNKYDNFSMLYAAQLWKEDSEKESEENMFSPPKIEIFR